MWDKIVNNVWSIAIVGDIGTGKTALMYDILSHFGKPVCFFKHPRPELILSLGFKQINELGEVEQLQDCALVIDEPQLYISLYQKKGNDTLRRLLSVCRQRGITLIIVTSDSRFITRGIESYIDCWCIKNLDFRGVKQGSKIKRIVQDTVMLSVDGFELKNEEYIFNSRKWKEFNGRHKFTEPTFFNSKLSKPYRLDETPTITPNKTATGDADGV